MFAGTLFPMTESMFPWKTLALPTFRPQVDYKESTEVCTYLYKREGLPWLVCPQVIFNFSPEFVLLCTNIIVQYSPLLPIPFRLLFVALISYHLSLTCVKSWNRVHSEPGSNSFPFPSSSSLSLRKKDLHLYLQVMSLMSYFTPFRYSSLST